LVDPEVLTVPWYQLDKLQDVTLSTDRQGVWGLAMVWKDLRETTAWKQTETDVKIHGTNTTIPKFQGVQCVCQVVGKFSSLETPSTPTRKVAVP